MRSQWYNPKDDPVEQTFCIIHHVCTGMMLDDIDIDTIILDISLNSNIVFTEAG